MRGVRVLGVLGIAIVVGVALGPQRAPAANANKPRIPAIWAPGPCLSIVDVSQTPVVHLEYSIASEEDGTLTEDEVDDSRRHQFFAFAAQHFEVEPPTWITQADIDRAALVDPMVMPQSIDPAVDILESATRWDGQWVRVTADDMRVPITFEQAMMGVDWDVSAVPPGTWLVKSYTWEPTKNLWSTRWSALKVVASASAVADAGPSVILLPDDATIETGVEHVLPGCVDAPAGSTLTVEYGVAEGSLEPDWQIAQENVEVATGDLAVGVELPRDVAGQPVQLRATITDPDGRTYAAYSPHSLIVIEGPETDDGDGGGCRIAADRASSIAWLLLFGLRRRRHRATLPS